MRPASTFLSAAGLRARVRGLGVAANGEELVFDADPPADLGPVLCVLHTGLRAQLAGKRWYGCDGSTGRVWRGGHFFIGRRTAAGHSLSPSRRTPTASSRWSGRKTCPTSSTITSRSVAYSPYRATSPASNSGSRPDIPLSQATAAAF